MLDCEASQAGVAETGGGLPSRTLVFIRYAGKKLQLLVLSIPYSAFLFEEGGPQRGGRSILKAHSVASRQLTLVSATPAWNFRFDNICSFRFAASFRHFLTKMPPPSKMEANVSLVSAGAKALHNP